MIVVLAGGVGAARFLRGLVEVVDPSEVTVVANTGDDAVIHGLRVSPDLDTLVYNLADAANPELGWGLSGETFAAMDALDRYGVPTWFRLGDRDLATHLYRTEGLARGATLSEVTAAIARAWGLEVRLLPMSDDRVATVVELADGRRVEFQEYFVKLRHEVAIGALEFDGASSARPAPGVLEAIARADKVVIAPSNPLVSIGPILAVGGIAEALEARRAATVAISPIVAGAAIKGPAARMLAELGHEPSALGVARLLARYAAALVVDEADAALGPAIDATGLRAVVTPTVMHDVAVAAALARTALGALDNDDRRT